MPRTDIKTLAATAEIVAAIAVVVSLIFVVVSVNQNTAALQSINDNFVYQLEDDRLADLANNAELTEVLAKFMAGEVLTGSERLRYDFMLMRVLNAWQLSFVRHADGMMSPSQWHSWDEDYKRSVLTLMPEEIWNNLKIGYEKNFQAHIDAAFGEKNRSLSN
jgi:hypothetical protein